MASWRCSAPLPIAVAASPGSLSGRPVITFVLNALSDRLIRGIALEGRTAGAKLVARTRVLVAVDRGCLEFRT